MSDQSGKEGFLLYLRFGQSLTVIHCETFKLQVMKVWSIQSFNRSQDTYKEHFLIGQ